VVRRWWHRWIIRRTRWLWLLLTGKRDGRYYELTTTFSDYTAIPSSSIRSTNFDNVEISIEFAPRFH